MKKIYQAPQTVEEAAYSATMLLANSVQGFSNSLGNTDGDQNVSAGDALVKENEFPWENDCYK